MLSPYERVLLAYLGKQPDQVPVCVPAFPIFGVPGLEHGAERANPNYLKWDRQTRVKKAIGFLVRFANRFPDICVRQPIGSGGHGGQSMHLAQILGPRLGEEVVLKESSKGGYAYTKPLIKDLATFDTERLYVPDLRKEPAMEAFLETLGARLKLEVEAYAGLEERLATGVNGWVTTRCVEDVVDQGLVTYRHFLIGMKLWPEKVHKLCEVMTECVITQLQLIEEVAGKITKLAINDHCTTFMSEEQAREFWVPYVQRVNQAFHGALHIYHNEGQIIHLVGLIPEAGFDGYQVGPETDLGEVREVVRNRIALYGNIDPVYLLPSGSPEAVEAACKDAIFKGGRHGGFILSTGGGPPRSGAPLKNVEAMVHAAKQYGTYPLPE